MEELTVLLDAYGDNLYNFCLYLAGNRYDGEDLFQETMLRATELLPKIDRDGNPKSYLISVAINLWKNSTQKRARRGRIAPEADVGGEAELIADPGGSAEAGALDRVMRGDLSRAVNELEDRYRIPVILFYSEGMKVSEIAKLLRKPDGTVKRLLHEARNRLRREMEGMGYE